MVTKILDSHVHFIDPGRPEGLAWPSPGSPLFRESMAADLLAESDAYNPDGCVVVETSRRPIDDDWLATLSAEESLVRGVVLNLQPDLPGFEIRLDKYLQVAKFVGVRLRPIDAYDLASNQLLKGVQQLEQNHKCIEFGAKSKASKRAMADLANRFQRTHWILDHCGHPDLDSFRDNEWLDEINAIASQPNTYCKVTGEYAFHAAWQPMLQALLAAFGTKRLIYGSNWPVCSIPGDVDKVVDRLAEWLGAHAADFFCENAKRAYNIATG